MTVTSSAATSTIPNRPMNSRRKKPRSTLRVSRGDVEAEAAEERCGERDAHDT